jgi:hypothetical protein
MFGLADISTAEFIMDLPEEYLKKPFKIGYFFEMLSITKSIFNFKYITALFRQEKYYKGYLKAEKEAIENIKKI